MPSKTFGGSRIRLADYEPSTRELVLTWDTGTAIAYKQVPEEVYRRLCSAPNPVTYWEDRIAEEYPKGAAVRKKSPAGDGKSLGDLFEPGED